MNVAGVLAVVLESWIWSRLVKLAGGGILSLAILGWVVESASRKTHDVVIHVTEPDVTVSVGGIQFSVAGYARAPYSCSLPVGGHELIMTRRGEVLQKETFHVRPNEEVVLVAHVPRGFEKGAARALRSPSARGAASVRSGSTRSALGGQAKHDIEPRGK